LPVEGNAVKSRQSKRKGLLAKLRPQSITLSPAPPFVSVTYSSPKKYVHRRPARRSKAPKEMNPIQRVTIPQLSKAKLEAVQKGDSLGAAFFGAMEFAITDPKKFRKYLDELAGG
jgi:hypothetical protein